MKMLRIFVPIPLLAALLVAGCGGDKELSKADFTKQANAVCSTYNAEVKKIGQPASMDDLPATADKVVAQFGTLISDLNDIKAPKDQADDFKALIKTAEDAKAQTQKLSDAAKSKDEAAVNKLADESATADKKSDALANKLGLTECSQN